MKVNLLSYSVVEILRICWNFIQKYWILIFLSFVLVFGIMSFIAIKMSFKNNYMLLRSMVNSRIQNSFQFTNTCVDDFNLKHTAERSDSANKKNNEIEVESQKKLNGKDNNKLLDGGNDKESLLLENADSLLLGNDV